MAAKGWIEVSDTYCKGCELCISACPQEVMELDMTHLTPKGYHPAHTFKDGCTGCAICAVVCPDAAITVYREVTKKPATVGATAPFVGLLGTVIGIYSALIKIGIAGQASIDAVAGPVGEALIMTAIGLFVAVPAVIAYNWLQSRNKNIQADLNQFANDVLGYMASNGAVKPTAPVVAAKPAPAAKPAAAPAAPAKK